MLKTCDEICVILKESYDDFVVDTKDYISFSTVIDMYLSTPYRFSDPENLELINTLFDLIKDNAELINEIGWDLPELLLKYVPSKAFSFLERLAQYPNIYALFNVFNLLVEKGNHKELFLKSCELLSTIGFNDDAKYFELFWGKDIRRVSDDTKEKYLDLKFHLLFEINTGCFKKIRTIYPSKFLSMKISSIIKFLNNNCVFLNNPMFIIRRIYVFARDYMQPQKPIDYDFDDVTNRKVQDDDDYLQGRLLQHLLTDCVEISLKYYQTDLIMNFSDYLCKYLDDSYQFEKIDELGKFSAADFKDITSKNHYYRLSNNRVSTAEFTECINRVFQLCLSFDINMREVLQKVLVDDTRNLYSKFITTNKASIDVDSGDDFKVMKFFKATNDSFFKLMTGIDSDDKDAIGKIPLSPLGCYLIYFSHLLDNVVHEIDDKKTQNTVGRLVLIDSLEDMILVSLRLLIPVLSINERISMNSVRSPPTYFIALWKRILEERKSGKNDDEKNELLMDYEELDTVIPLDLNTMETEELVELEKNIDDNEGLIYYCFWNRNFKLNSQSYFPYLQNLILFSNINFYKNNGFERLKEITRESEGNEFCFFIKIYMQCLLSIAARQRREDVCRTKNTRLIMDYLTEFLKHCDQNFSWKFIIESLRGCPYLSAKIDLIKIMKVMGSEIKSPKSIEMSLKSLSINPNLKQLESIGSIETSTSKDGTETPEESSKPALPPRKELFYLSLVKSRRDELLELINETMDEIFGEKTMQEQDLKTAPENPSSHANNLSQSYQLLLTYLNLVYSLNHFFEKSELNQLHSNIETKLSLEQNPDNNSSLLRLFNSQIEKLI